MKIGEKRKHGNLVGSILSNNLLFICIYLLCMIKKNTKAIFLDGGFEGEYDWKGGIPLSEGEIMAVKINGKLIQYKLVKKEVSCNVETEDQIVLVVYTFKTR